jgi:hypothetical protein
MEVELNPEMVIQRAGGRRITSKKCDVGATAMRNGKHLEKN